MHKNRQPGAWLWCLLLWLSLSVGPLEGSEPLGATELREQLYHTEGFVLRKGGSENSSHGPVWTDMELPGDDPIEDRNLIIFVEGSGDQVKHFHYSVSVLLDSEVAVGSGEPILAVLVHWSRTTKIVVEHLSGPNQQAGAQALQEMVVAHQQRWGQEGSCTLIGFSAGTRVIQQAFGAEGVTDEEGNALPALPVPAQMSHVTHIVYLGSSMLREDKLPYDGIRGHFINFQNPRDTHYGDSAPYAAPAGTKADVGRGAKTIFFKKRPRAGASANGFLEIPTLTAKGKWRDAEGSKMDKPAEWPKKINFVVPRDLIPLGIGQVPLPIPTLFDTLDDFWNNAQNHFIMVARGPKGAVDHPTLRWYRGRAQQFVKTEVAQAVFAGELAAGR